MPNRSLSQSSFSIRSRDLLCPDPYPPCRVFCRLDVNVVGFICPAASSSSSDNLPGSGDGTRNPERTGFLDAGRSDPDKSGEPEASKGGDVDSSLESIGGAFHSGSGRVGRASFEGKLLRRCPWGRTCAVRPSRRRGCVLEAIHCGNVCLTLWKRFRVDLSLNDH